MKPIRFVFPAILIFYALLYIATTRVERCDDQCQKYYGVDTMLRKNRPYVYDAFKCADTVFCLYVNDSIARNWPGLADTACSYLRSVSLPPVRIIVASANTNDTLVSQRCS